MRAVYLLAVLMLLTGRSEAAAMSSAMIVEMKEITSASVSPDGTRAVVGISYSNPRTNQQELSWVIVSVRDGGALKTIPAGGVIFDPRTPGAVLTRQALWSSDGRWFFYLRRDGDEVQLWETRSDGGLTRQVTHSTSDLIDLKRSSDPDEFIVQLTAGRAELRRAEENEYRSGILYDDHIIGGFTLTRTLPAIGQWRSVRRMSKGEASQFVPVGWREPTGAVFDVPLRRLNTAPTTVPATFAVSENGSSHVTIIPLSPMPKDPYYYEGQYTLQLEPKAAGNPAQKCEIAECTANRITVIGWSPGGEELFYLADSLQGPLAGDKVQAGAAIYAWNPRRNGVRLIHDAGKQGLWARLYNLVSGGGLSFAPSPIVGREIVTVFAGADQPPRLEAINLDTGISRILLDPNAELRSMTRGRALWRTWETSIGYSGRGMIVLPDDYHAGEKYPAVITTYGCGNGFLRGGSGDNAPEFVLAHQGFIAVCIDVRVREIIARETDFGRVYPVYCEIVSGLIADLAKNGMLDPTRVGLTGQSLGSVAGAYCISRSSAIAAAAFRHGSSPERASWELFTTSDWERGPNSVYGLLNLPDPRNDPTGRWDELSVAQRAREINTPTLIQTDDSEYLNVLPFWSAMHDEGKPIEMHVFPEEAHLLVQPIHMLVNFERQLDWFKFWLKREEDMSPSKLIQYDRWKRLRELVRNSQAQH